MIKSALLFGVMLSTRILLTPSGTPGFLLDRPKFGKKENYLRYQQKRFVIKSLNSPFNRPAMLELHGSRLEGYTVARVTKTIL